MHNKYSPRSADSSSSGLQWLLWPALILAALLALLVSSIPLTVDQQFLFVLASLGLSLLVRPKNDLARYRVIVLVSISVIATGRYIYWRLTESLGWFDSSIDLSPLDYLFSFGLLAAEIYAWTVLFLGYIQTIWPLRRPSYPMSKDRSNWPSVDVVIPTYNEPLNVVAPSVLAAAKLDWPADKLNVYLLDDGCREEFRDFAAEAGVQYIERESSEGAKAGNINHALERVHAEYVAIFDCDHVPVRSFLTKTMGWFSRDPNLAIVQTPHLFFTPDPVERNLQIYHRVPPEGQLFYGLVQDGNDTWNASFFCGSCAVLRREAIDEIGGIATDTVTEDAHTSLLIQKNGWNTAYLNEPLAAGLATERLSHHIGQRMRWARGMIQVFRTDNPIIAKGLSMGQRLCYFNAMLHFFFGLPRLIFLTAPLAYLFFEAYVIQASAALIAVYALPHIFQAQVANSVMQGRYRHSFWADVYETMISAHLLAPTLGALINPTKGKFNVTDKGGIVDKDHFDWRSSKIVFLLLMLNLIGLLVAFVRLFWINTDEAGTVLINLAWTVYNSIILGAALSVAWEKRQRRDTPRIHREVPALLHTQDGRSIEVVSSDLSMTGASLQLPGNVQFSRDEKITVEFFDGDTGYRFKGTVKTPKTRHLGVLFDPMTPSKMSDLVYFSHGRDDSWDDWYNIWRPSKPLASFFEIVRFGVLGMFKALSGHSDDPENKIRPGISTAAWLAFVFLLVVGSYFVPELVRADEQAQTDSSMATKPVENPATQQSKSPQETTKDSILMSFKQLGIAEPIRLRGGNTQDTVWFSLRADQVAKSAQLTLQFQLAQQLLKDYQSLDIRLNNQFVGSIPIKADNVDLDLSEVFSIDPLFISDQNQLSFKLEPIEATFCEKLDFRAVTARISVDSQLEMTMHPLDLANDLNLFPIPFYDPHDDSKLVLPVVLTQKLSHSTAALKAAGILSSWFGGKTDYRGAEFPVLINQTPASHALVFATPESQFSFLPNLEISGPGVEIRSLPETDKEHIKLLIIKGRNEDELISAATTLVSGQQTLSGQDIAFTTPSQPPYRVPYDAPRWLNDQGKTYFSELAPPDGFDGYGISPDRIDINFRIAPDLYFWRKDEIPINIDYHYSDLPLEEESSLDISLGDEWLRSLEVKTTTRTLESLSAKDAQPLIKTIEKQNSLAIKKFHLAGLNTLSLFYNLELPEEAAQTCASLYTENMKTGIDPGSHFDLTGWIHFARMPDNAKIANSGFPFTRLADLSETTLILPNKPNPGEIGMMLDLLGKFSSSTGYPAFRITVAMPDQVADAENQDIIIIGSDERQPLLEDWQMHMPVVQNDAGQWQIRTFSFWEKAQLWWNGEQSHRLEKAEETLSSTDSNAIITTSFESPLTSKRTVLLMLASRSEDYSQISNALQSVDLISKFQHDLTLLGDGNINSYRLAPSYYTGHLSWLTWTRWYLANHIIALLLLFTAIVLVMSLILKILLKRRAEARFDFDLKPAKQ